LNYTVWISQKISNIGETLRSLQSEIVKYQLPIEILYSDSRYDSFSDAHYFLREPQFIESEYYRWCLEIIEKYNISLFLPQRRSIYLAKYKELFEKQNILFLSVGDSQTLNICHDKGKLYHFLEKTDVPIAPFYLIETLEEFEISYRHLAEKSENICIKPRKSAGSRGFKLIYEKNEPITWFDTEYQIFYQELLKSFAQGVQSSILMEYLPEDEISVDCLVKNQELIAYVARIKFNDNIHERIICDNTIFSHCAKIVKALNLNGLFNIQFKGKNGIYYFLEINTRMSGGIHYSNQSGVNLLFWAIALHLNLLDSKNIPSIQENITIIR